MTAGLVQVDGGSRWVRLEHPARIVEAGRPEDVAAALHEVQASARRHGRWAFGFIRYEAGQAFGLRVAGGVDRHPLPLVWFALFDPDTVQPVDAPRAVGAYEIGDLRPTLDRPQFRSAFARIKRHIADGDTYQVNFTFKLRAPFRGDPESLFADLIATQQGRYGAFIRIGDHVICSASPELFFAFDGGIVCAKPMKGTAARGRTADEDADRGRALAASVKDRAENIMIVDMMRNDIGRIATVGSVEASSLCTVERYPNVWQLTSTVTGATRASLPEIAAALFPSASVTGAPKVRTMEIIQTLETEPRGVYTGTVGYLMPDGRMQFNVAIRTAVVDGQRGRVEFGVGSGVVWDSEADAEYDECLLKGSVLGRRPAAFELLETMRWTPEEGVFLLERHLVRLEQSARYFGFQISRAQLRAAVDGTVRGADRPLRLRLLLSADGAVRVERHWLRQAPGVWRVRLAATPVDPSTVLLFHKTTDRRVYRERQLPACDDVILWNTRGEATESTIENLVVEIDGRRLTPPVGCGLLPGTLRAELLDTGQVEEGIVRTDDLPRASRMWLANSVRGLWPAALL